MIALNLISFEGHGQDQPQINPGYIEESDGNVPGGSDAHMGNSSSPFSKKNEDDAVWSDSTRNFDQDAGGLWGHIKHRGPQMKNGSGIGPDDPGPDPDAPFDSGLIALFAIGLLYSIKKYSKKEMTALLT